MGRIATKLLTITALALGTLAASSPGAGAGGVDGVASAPPPVAPPGVLAVSTRTTTRGGTVRVTATGCTEDFQYVEVRLVVRQGGGRASAAVASAGPEGATLTVPRWAPSGAASVEASCLEPNLSGAADGADIVRFEYRSVPVRIASSPRIERAPSFMVGRVVHGGILQVSGSGCAGRVLVSLAKGRDLVASASRFHYGQTLVTADPGGTWSAAIPLRYAVSEFSDPVAPGPMSAFAVCEGTAYPPRSFEVSRLAPKPAVHVLPWNPSGVFVAQCPAHNTMTIVATASRPAGSQRLVLRVPGHEFGEAFQFFDLPPDATSVTYAARCQGRDGTSFDYAPATATLN